MHEVGHNLGLAHANEVGTYNDQSGMMGFSYSQDNGPIMCFNGPKSWQLGWYASRQYVFDQTDGSWSGRLIGQVDLDNPDALSTDVVLLKLNTGTSTDYYVWFNRRTGTNSGTKEGGDQVMIARAGAEGESYAESELLAKRSGGGSYTIGNFDGSGLDLTLTVNSINTGANPGYAEVTVFAGCTLDSECDDGNSCNGSETCIGGQCSPGVLQTGCCGNGVCEAGDTFVTCPADGCTYDCGADCRTLLTTFDANNGASGNIFKVEAVQDIVITGFTIHTSDAGSGTVKIWDRTGDYVGSEGDPEAWNLIMNEGFTGAGFGQQTPLADLGVPILIPAGTFRSFYVYSSLGVQYTNGSVEGSIYSTNAGEIIFYEGKGTAGEIGAGTYAPRVWNGIIQYGLATDDVMVSDQRNFLYCICALPLAIGNNVQYRGEVHCAK